MPKPRAKNSQEKQAALDQMLSIAAPTNDLADQVVKPASKSPDNDENSDTASAPLFSLEGETKIEEQKGEDTLPTPAETTIESPAPLTVVPDDSSSVQVDTLPGETENEPAPISDSGTLDLASLFIAAADKKVFTMRLTDSHYQYLLLLGTIIGNGTSPPDIVHNIIAQFIEQNDTQIQKAITKHLRRRQQIQRK